MNVRHPSKPSSSLNHGVRRAVLLVCLGGMLLGDWPAENAGSLRAELPPAVSSESIWFLQIHVGDAGCRLVRADVRPGHFKSPRFEQKKGAWACELRDGEGRLLWKGRMEDPRRRRIESSDPALDGGWTVREVVLDEADFTLRLPHFPSARALWLGPVSARIPPTGSEAPALRFSIPLTDGAPLPTAP